MTPTRAELDQIQAELLPALEQRSCSADIDFVQCPDCRTAFYLAGHDTPAHAQCSSSSCERQFLLVNGRRVAALKDVFINHPNCTMLFLDGPHAEITLGALSALRVLSGDDLMSDSAPAVIDVEKPEEDLSDIDIRKHQLAQRLVEVVEVPFMEGVLPAIENCVRQLPLPLLPDFETWVQTLGEICRVLKQHHAAEAAEEAAKAAKNDAQLQTTLIADHDPKKSASAMQALVEIRESSALTLSHAFRDADLELLESNLISLLTVRIEKQPSLLRPPLGDCLRELLLRISPVTETILRKLGRDLLSHPLHPAAKKLLVQVARKLSINGKDFLENVQKSDRIHAVRQAEEKKWKDEKLKKEQQLREEQELKRARQEELVRENERKKRELQERRDRYERERQERKPIDIPKTVDQILPNLDSSEWNAGNKAWYVLGNYEGADYSYMRLEQVERILAATAGEPRFIEEHLGGYSEETPRTKGRDDLPNHGKWIRKSTEIVDNPKYRIHCLARTELARRGHTGSDT